MKAMAIETFLKDIAIETLLKDIAIETFLNKEKRVGGKWKNFYKPPTVDGNFSLLDSMLMLLLDSGIHILIAWYMENVAPGEFGIPKPYHFCFTPSFWISKPTIDTIDSDGKKPESKYFEKEPTDKIAGIRILNLYKKFGQNCVVNGITLNLYEGQITALLGHNGAGKSTTMFMLTGFYPATSGTAIIGGHDIKTNLESAREGLGFCPQHDILFDTLTVYQHLMFFAKVKGVRTCDLIFQVDQMAMKVDLQSVMNTLAKNLSGGQKRKLSLAIALIGGSKVVILDEPTSGIDPTTRRHIWSVLQEARKDRTILLSTHFMDEADVLGGRIAILVDGVVKCCGSPLFLKKLYGTGYHLAIVTRKDCKVSSLTNFIKNYIPSAELETVRNTEVSYLLPDSESSKFSNLFHNLEYEKVKLKIDSFGTSVTNMEEVFLKVRDTLTESDNEDDVYEGLKNKNIYGPDDALISFNTDYNKKSGFWLVCSRMYGIMVKKFICFRRQYSLTAMLILFPILTALLIYWINIKSNNSSNHYQFSLNFDLSPFGQTYIPYTDGINSTTSHTHFTTLYAKQFSPPHQTEFFKIGRDSNFDNYTLYRADKLGLDTFNKRMVIGMEVARVDPSRVITCIAYYNVYSLHSSAISVNYVLNTIYQFILNDTFSIQTSIHLLPRPVESAEDLKVSPLFTTILICITLYVISTLFMIFPIQEREVGVKHIQTICGVSPVTYWLPTFLLDFVIFMLTTAPLVMVSIICKVSPYVDDGRWLLLIVVLALYGWGMLPHMYAFQFLFKSTRKAVTLGIFYNLFIGELVSWFIEKLGGFDREANDLTFLTLMVLFPSYTITICFGNIIANYENLNWCQEYQPHCLQGATHECCKGTCGDECVPYYSDYTNWDMPGIGAVLFCMFLQGVVYILFVLVIDYNVIQWIWYIILCNSEDHNEISYTEDEDVAAERQRIISNINSTSSDSLVLYNLYKKYSNLVVVDHICLGVPEQECFGLLGQNGAGKTTIFKMLTGAVMVTGGNAYLKGFDVKNNIRKVQAQMGYCPQFDALINDMTGRETLTLYARLRGIPEDKIQMVVERLADSLMFTPHIDKYVSQYSGGNKRKLCTAVALIGNPSFVMLDEPSAGLDPEAKRRMWNIFSLVRASGCTFVLTSHSMEECEAVSTRLAIMVNGRFMCLGSPQHLKNKFGQGYTLIIQLLPKEDGTFSLNQPVVNFITSHFHDAKVFDDHQGYIHFQIPDARVKLADIFDKMEAAKSVINVKDYSVHQTTLGQIFLTFTKLQEEPTLKITAWNLFCLNRNN